MLLYSFPSTCHYLWTCACKVSWMVRRQNTFLTFGNLLCNRCGHRAQNKKIAFLIPPRTPHISDMPSATWRRPPSNKTCPQCAVDSLHTKAVRHLTRGCCWGQTQHWDEVAGELLLLLRNLAEANFRVLFHCCKKTGDGFVEQPRRLQPSRPQLLGGFWEDTGIGSCWEIRKTSAKK